MNNNILNEENNSGIYQIRNIENDKVYVGQTKSLRTRKSSHFRSLSDGKHYNNYLQRSFNKYGKSKFVFEVLEYCEEEKLNKLERHWIKLKESEYKQNGFNASYAYVLFKKYDSNRRINITKRKPVKHLYTDERRRKYRESIALYWREEENHISSSLNKSSLDYDIIIKIKKMLAEDLSKCTTEIANELDVSKVIVIHTSNLKCYTTIGKEYNYIIRNRDKILKAREDKTIIRMYRYGCASSEIGRVINLHHRSIIKRVQDIKTVHDDRCRLNAINKSHRKKNSLVMTMFNMGFNTVVTSKVLGVSRCDVSLIRKGEVRKEFQNVNETRGMFTYK